MSNCNLPTTCTLLLNRKSGRSTFPSAYQTAESYSTDREKRQKGLQQFSRNVLFVPTTPPICCCWAFLGCCYLITTNLKMWIRQFHFIFLHAHNMYNCTLYTLQWGQGRRQSAILSVPARIRPELMRETWLHIPRASEVPCFVAWINNFTHGGEDAGMHEKKCTRFVHQDAHCAKTKESDIEGDKSKRKMVRLSKKSENIEKDVFLLHKLKSYGQDTMIQRWIWQQSLL